MNSGSEAVICSSGTVSKAKSYHRDQCCQFKGALSNF